MEDILICMKKNSVKMLGIVANSSLVRPTKTEQKTILKAARASKKLKYIDDSIVAEEAQAIALRNN